MTAPAPSLWPMKLPWWSVISQRRSVVPLPSHQTIGYQDGLNLYAYTGNDPINRGDPAGTSDTIIVPGTRPDPFLYHWLDRFWWERGLEATLRGCCVAG